MNSTTTNPSSEKKLLSQGNWNGIPWTVSKQKHHIILDLNPDERPCSYDPQANTLPISPWYKEHSNITDVIFHKNIDLSQCTSMEKLFQNYKKLKTVCCNSAPVHLPNISSMSFMFRGCPELISVNLSAFYIDCRNTIDLSYMFHDCMKLKYINLFHCHTVHADCRFMFINCHLLRKADLSRLIFTGRPSWIQTDSMFCNCWNLQDLQMPQCESGCLPYLQQMDFMFYQCMCIKHIDLSSFVNDSSSMNYTFNRCYNLLNITPFHSFTNKTVASNCFKRCSELEIIDFPKLFGPYSTFNRPIHLYDFNSCKSLQTLVLPEQTILSQGYHEHTQPFFDQHPNLKHINLPASASLKQIIPIHMPKSFKIDFLWRKYTTPGSRLKAIYKLLSFPESTEIIPELLEHQFLSGKQLISLFNYIHNNEACLNLDPALKAFLINETHQHDN